MRSSKKALSLLLALVMLLSCASVIASAVTTLYSISVNDVKVPVVGEKIPATVSATVTNGAKISGSYWTKKMANGTFAKTTDATFQADGEYGVYLSLQPADGYTFAAESNMLAYVNGNTASYKHPAPNSYSISYRFGKALTAISSIAITDVTVPAVGTSISSTVSATFSGGVVATGSYWTRKDAGGNFSKTSDTAFQPGGEYGVYLTLQAKTGYGFGSSVSATVNGNTALAQKQSSGNYAVTYRFPALPKINEIKSIAVTGVTAPVVGAAPVKTGYSITTGVKVNEFNWTNKIAGGAYATTTDTTFQTGKDYGVSFKIAPADGYAFAKAADMAATVNGKTATFTNPAPNVYYLSYSFGEPTKTITSVAITGLSEPSVGAAVSTSGIKASTGFTITESYWSKKGSSGMFTKTSDTTFQNGGEYSLYVSGKLAAGYTAPTLPTATVNGRPATVQKNGGNYSISVRYNALTQNVLVTFNPVGGTLTDAQKTKIVTVGNTYGGLPTPTKDGYTFEGWFVSWNGGDKKVDASTKVEKTTNHELTAHWKKNETTSKTITVTFEPNGGTLADKDKTKIVTVGLAYGQLPVPTRDGYTFEGWLNGSNEKVTAATTVTKTADHILSAKWEKLVTKDVTVTFDATPGLVTPTSKTVTVGTKYGELPIASRGGYKFLGWFDDTDAQIDSQSIVNKSTDHTLKAKWESMAKTVTVTFDADGGIVSPASKTAEPGKLYGELPTPTKANNTFIGWYTADSVKITADTVVPYSVDHTLKAKWAENGSKPTVVTLDPGEGTVEAASKTLEPGKPFGELPTPTKPGYVFLGWFDKDGNKITATDLVPSGDFTLVAKWEAETKPHTEHVFDEGKVTKEATCTATGEKIFTCTVCGAVKTETIPMAAHTYTDAVMTKKATCISSGEQSFTCSVCGGSYVEVVPKTDHAYKTVKTAATLKKSGTVERVCTVCGDSQRVSTIYRPKTFTLSKTKFTYNGKAKKPAVTVTDTKGKVIGSENYTLKYYYNKQVGTAKVKVIFKGDYSGSKTLNFKILPRPTAIKKLAAGTKSLKAVWKALNSGNGYQLQYALKKNFKGAKTITIKDETVTSKKIAKLQSGKVYYVRIRTLQLVDGKYYASVWSEVKKVKVK